MKIYLAGSVPKGAEEEKEFVNWRLTYKSVLEKFMDADFIFPGAGDMDERDFLLIVGKDSRSIKHSDFIVEKVQEIEAIKDRLFLNPAKDISIIDEAVSHLESKPAEYKNSSDNAKLFL